MTDSSDAEHFRSVVVFQLALLGFYESLLEMSGWDETKVNTTLKTFMSAVLALLRVQQSLGTQVVTLQRDLIHAHRARLERWLEEHPGPSGDGAERNGVAASPDERVGRGHAQ